MNRWPLYSSGHFSRFDGTLFQFIRSAVYRGRCLIPALMTLKGWRQLRSQLLHDTSVCISNKCPGQFRFNLTGQEMGLSTEMLCLAKICHQPNCHVMCIASGWCSAKCCFIADKFAKQYSLLSLSVTWGPDYVGVQ